MVVYHLSFCILHRLKLWFYLPTVPLTTFWYAYDMRGFAITAAPTSVHPFFWTVSFLPLYSIYLFSTIFCKKIKSWNWLRPKLRANMYYILANTNTRRTISICQYYNVPWRTKNVLQLRQDHQLRHVVH